jgi:hypothetical protein
VATVPCVLAMTSVFPVEDGTASCSGNLIIKVLPKEILSLE